eukprot:6554368-Prymnesium_polylepis.5
MIWHRAPCHRDAPAITQRLAPFSSQQLRRLHRVMLGCIPPRCGGPREDNLASESIQRHDIEHIGVDGLIGAAVEWVVDACAFGVPEPRAQQVVKLLMGCPGKALVPQPDAPHGSRRVHDKLVAAAQLKKPTPINVRLEALPPAREKHRVGVQRDDVVYGGSQQVDKAVRKRLIPRSRYLAVRTRQAHTVIADLHARWHGRPSRGVVVHHGYVDSARHDVAREHGLQQAHELRALQEARHEDGDAAGAGHRRDTLTMFCSSHSHTFQSQQGGQPGP